MRFTKLALLTLGLTLIFSGCYKDNDMSYNPHSIKEIPEETTTVIGSGFSSPFHQPILETHVSVFHLMITLIRESLARPDLFNFGSTSVEVRSGCPDFITTSGTLGSYPVSIDMTFDDGSGSCMNSGVLYDGSISVDFNGAIGTNVAGADIQVTAFNSLMINGYTFSLAGPINLEFNSGTFSYDYTLAGDLVSSKPDPVTGHIIETTIPSGAMGSFTLGANNSADPDNVLDPSSFADNTFLVGIMDELIHCENTTTGSSSDFCVDTSDDIELTPQICSCPTDGTMRMKDNNGTCTTPIDDSNSAQFDFGNGTCTGNVTELEKVVLFLSYEGTMSNVVNGPATGLTSTDVGVVESNSTTGSEESLQLTGTGSVYGDFSWSSPSTWSQNSLNSGQTLNTSSTSLLPWINEFHYDNAGSDTNEAIEVAGPAGIDLACYQLVLYNGNNDGSSGSVTYDTENLSGIIPDEGNGFGAITFPISGIQNGARDGFALVKEEKITPLTFCQ